MIVLVLTALGVASALYTRQRALRLAQLPLRDLWLVWLAFLSQILFFEVIGHHIPVWTTNAWHLATYVLCIVFIFRNRALPGAWIISAGAAANLTAIVANGGTMPANADAWRRAGLPEPTAFENSAAVEDPKLAFLGDVFYIPDRFPLANVFSIGDVLIVIGGTYLAHRWCSGLDSPVASRTTGRATSRPDTPASPADTELPVA